MLRAPARMQYVGGIALRSFVSACGKLRASAELTDKDRVIHEHGLVSLLKKIHDDLDAAVFEAYGWPLDLTDEQILEKLVALNAERAKEEEKGLVRSLRPEYQIPRFGKQTQTEIISSESDDGADVAGAAPATRVPWPSDAIGQIIALSALAATRAIGVEEVMSHFLGARRDLATRHLETLAILGELHLVGEGLYAAPPAVT